MILAGRDPRTVSTAEWCDVAWVCIMEMSGAMMNPFEFRESMWSVLYEGEAPAPKPKTDPPARRARGAKALPPPKPGPAHRMSKRDAKALEAFNAEILEIAKRRQSSLENTPES